MTRQKNVPSTKVTKKLLNIIKKKYPGASDDEIPKILSELKRFVRVTHKIATEPQAQIYYKEKKVKGKMQKHKITETGIGEFKKVMRGNKKMPLGKAFGKFSKIVNKNEQ